MKKNAVPSTQTHILSHFRSLPTYFFLSLSHHRNSWTRTVKRSHKRFAITHSHTNSGFCFFVLFFFFSFFHRPLKSLFLSPFLQFPEPHTSQVTTQTTPPAVADSDTQTIIKTFTDSFTEPIVKQVTSRETATDFDAFRTNASTETAPDVFYERDNVRKYPRRKPTQGPRIASPRWAERT